MFQKEGYPLDWLQELKEKNNIVEVISRYVQLQQKGGKFWCCCPFHHEKTASMCVNEDGQFYHCFGCGESGDVITFIMKMEGMTFPEAVAFLAERAGMQVPTPVGFQSNAESKQKRDRLYEILTLTAKFYYKSLMSDEGKDARTYLEKRGVDKNLMTRFGLGFSPSYDGVIKYLKEQGFSEAEMLDCGVAWQSDKSKRVFDALQGRMIVPIFDMRGRVVAFSGRAVTKEFSGGKYVNYRNTKVFEKGKVLYAANFVKKEKQKVAIDRVIVVEGYMDVISLAKYGFNNAIAGMGTAFTPEQARALRTLSENVCVCYDGDAAGQHATVRNLEILNKEGLNLKVVSIPENGMDPDDYVKKYGHAGFEKLLDNAVPYVEFVLSVIEKDNDLSTNTGRAKYVNEALAFIKTLPETTGRDVYLEIVHDKSRVAMNILRDGLVNEISEVVFSEPQIQKSELPVSLEAARFVLNKMASGEEYAKPMDVVSRDVFGDNEVHKLVYDYVKEKTEAGEKPQAHMLYSLSQDEEVANVLNSVKEFHDETKLIKYYRDSVKLLNLNYVNYRIKTLSQSFDACPDASERRRILTDLSVYQNMLKSLK